MKIMVRADDLGYSKGINYGIYDTVKKGIIKNIGFMVNMPESVNGYELIKNLDVCLGQHTNVCVGKPVSDPSLIPSLVQDNGEFKTSRMYRTASKDFVVLEEALIEVEAQYQRFKEITHQEPSYFEAHAVASKNLLKAIEIVAHKHHLKFNDVSFDGHPVQVAGEKLYMHLESMKEGYDPLKSFIEMIEHAHSDGVDLFICHPGYLDAYILNTSSLTLDRTKEVEMLCSDEIKEYLTKHNIHLYTYDEIGKGVL